jgi:hypothetical protein
MQSTMRCEVLTCKFTRPIGNKRRLMRHYDIEPLFKHQEKLNLLQLAALRAA